MVAVQLHPILVKKIISDSLVYNSIDEELFLVVLLLLL